MMRMYGIIGGLRACGFSQLRVFMFRYIVLTALVIGMLLAAACGSPSESQPSSAAPEPAASEEVRVGSDIGNRLPDFELTLTSNGEKLTSTSLVESGRPAFLFFFATT